MEMNTIVCRSCDEELPETMFYRSSDKRYVDRKCRDCKNEENRRRRINFKQKCVDYKGGSCVVCGYNRCNGALDFHHLDPTQKDYNIGEKCGRGFIETIQAELDKCVLVCRNCHSEIHAGLVDITAEHLLIR